MIDDPTFPSGVSISLDDERRLKYGHNALCEFENELGKPIGSLFSEEQVGFNTIRVLLWAGLIWETPGLTVDEAGQLIDQVPEEAAEDITNRAKYVLERCLLAFGANQVKTKKKTPAKKSA